MRNAVGIILGLVAGFMTVMLLQLVSSAIYPPPEGMDWTDQVALEEWISGLPTGAFVIVLISHALGALVGALACAVIVGRHWIPGTLVIGGFFMLGGIMNIVSIPHPVWFAFVDLVLYIPAAFAGGWLAAGLSGSKSAESSPGE